MSAVDEHIRQFFAAYKADSGLAIAYSGGPDSHALFLSLAALRHALRQTLRAIHVHHGIHPLADEWAARCVTVGRRVAVRTDVLRVTVPDVGGSLEEAAREARYTALLGALAEGEALVTAHTLEDQSETVLLQLFRGAGPAGLAAMGPISSIGNHRLYRPLLSVSKRALLGYLREQDESFIADPANTDARFDRSFLRSEVMPVLRQRWPKVDEALGRAALWQAEATHLVDKQADSDMRDCLGGVDERQLNCSRWLRLHRHSEYRALNVLRSWLRSHGFRAPSRARLMQIVRDVVLARGDAQPRFRLDHHYNLCRSGGSLYIVRTEVTSVPWATSWSPPAPLDLPHGSLTIVEGAGGLDPAMCGGKTWLVAPRRGGETLELAGRPGRRKVKKLLQELQIPPWYRASLPFVFDGETVVAVADLWLNRHYQAAPAEPGWVLKWTPK